MSVTVAAEWRWKKVIYASLHQYHDLIKYIPGGSILPPFFWGNFSQNLKITFLIEISVNLAHI